MVIINKIVIVAIALILSFSPICFAQSAANDSTRIANHTKQQSWQMAAAALPIVFTGVITKATMPDFRPLDSYTNTTNSKIFDALQYSPAIAMLGIKAFGVESRSSWGRMITADAFSAVMMVGAVEGLKRTNKEQRPDGEDYRSFPSGHSAVSFMAATMLAREYGWRSAWYTIGAYSVATATSVSRMIQEKHWAGDIVTGAGIGIMATNLGYFFSDLIFKNRGLSNLYTTYNPSYFTKNPSYFAINSGLAIPLSDITVNSTTLNLSSGIDASLSGSYSLSPSVGIKANLSLRSISLSVDNGMFDHISPLTSISATVGPSLFIPISNRLNSIFDLGLGYNQYLKLKNHSDLIDVKSSSFAGDAYFSLAYAMLNDFRIRTYIGYNVSKIGITINHDHQPLNLKTGNTNKWVNSLTIGISSDITF